MKPTNRLENLERVCGRRLLRLRSLVDTLPWPAGQPHDRIVAYVVMESNNLLAEFVRSLFLSCSMQALSSSGLRITHPHPGLAVTDAALRFAIKAKSPKKALGATITRLDEPRWNRSSDFLKVFSALGASNFSQIAAGFSSTPVVFASLPEVRNFYAHRNQSTADRVRQVARSMSVTPGLHPTNVMCFRMPGRPQNIIADWLDDLRSAITVACA